MFRFIIYREPVCDFINIAIIEDRGNGKRYLAKPVEFIFEELKEYKTTKPTIRIAGYYSQQFLTALAEALDENNIKTDKDAKIQGTLEATRYHLEDTRSLLKLPRRRKKTK